MTPLERTALVHALLEAKREGGLLPRQPAGYRLATRIERRVRREADRASRLVRRGVDQAVEAYRRHDDAVNRRVNMQNAERVRREGYAIRPDFAERSEAIARQAGSAGARARSGTGVDRWRGAYAQAQRDARAKEPRSLADHPPRRRLPGDPPRQEPREPSQSYAPGDRTWRRVERAREERSRLLRPPQPQRQAEPATPTPRALPGDRRESDPTPRPALVQRRSRLPGEQGGSTRRPRK